MSCLDALFTLTPQSPWYYTSAQQYGSLYCYGVDYFSGSARNLSTLYPLDQVYFSYMHPGDPTLDYTLWANRRTAPSVDLWLNLSGVGPSKSLALVFGFEVGWGTSHIQIYNSAGKIADRTLAPGDNQLLLEVESLDNGFNLFFMHTGGDWFFKGISGYVV